MSDAVVLVGLVHRVRLKREKKEREKMFAVSLMSEYEMLYNLAPGNPRAFPHNTWSGAMPFLEHSLRVPA